MKSRLTLMCAVWFIVSCDKEPKLNQQEQLEQCSEQISASDISFSVDEEKLFIEKANSPVCASTSIQITLTSMVDSTRSMQFDSFGTEIYGSNRWEFAVEDVPAGLYRLSGKNFAVDNVLIPEVVLTSVEDSSYAPYSGGLYSELYWDQGAGFAFLTDLDSSLGFISNDLEHVQFSLPQLSDALWVRNKTVNRLAMHLLHAGSEEYYLGWNESIWLTNGTGIEEIEKLDGFVTPVQGDSAARENSTAYFLYSTSSVDTQYSNLVSLNTDTRELQGIEVLNPAIYCAYESGEALYVLDVEGAVRDLRSENGEIGTIEISSSLSENFVSTYPLCDIVVGDGWVYLWLAKNYLWSGSELVFQSKGVARGTLFPEGLMVGDQLVSYNGEVLLSEIVVLDDGTPTVLTPGSLEPITFIINQFEPKDTIEVEVKQGSGSYSMYLSSKFQDWDNANSILLEARSVGDHIELLISDGNDKLVQLKLVLQ